MNQQPATPAQRLAALEQVAANARLLLDRLAAMEQSGALSNVAAEALAAWATRLAASLQAVPAVPPTEQEES